MWFNKKSNNRIEDKGWQAMKALLDQELPEKKNKRRTLLWLWPVAAGFIGVMLVQAGFLDIWTTADSAKAGHHYAETKVDTKTPEGEEAAHTYALSETVNPTKKEAESYGSTQNNAVANTPGNSTVNKDNSKPAANMIAFEHPAEKELAAPLTTENAAHVQPSHPENTLEVAEKNREAGTSTDMTASGQSRDWLDIAALPGIEAEINKTTPAPEMVLKLERNQTDSPFSIRPYLSLGIFGPPALDRAGYTVGGGLSLNFSPWLGLSVGAAYEKYRGQYDYQGAFAAVNDVNEFSAYTDVRQISVPVMLQIRLPKTRYAFFGGISKNYIQNTANYYAIPSKVEASTLPSFDINSEEFASTAAASIPPSYFEWQVGARMRLWKSAGLSVQYRAQFEKQKNGIIPGYNQVGVGLTFGLH